VKKYLAGTFLFFWLFFACSLAVSAQAKYEGATIAELQVVLDEPRQIQAVSDQFEAIIRPVLTDRFSAVKNREALAALFDSKRVATARIEVIENANDSVTLRFVIKRTTLVEQVFINIGEQRGDKVTEDELISRLNLLTTDAVVNERAVQQSADALQTYLRERGYYQATVDFNYEPPAARANRSNVSFNVTPGTQATVEAFNIQIAGFNSAEIADDLKLKPSETFSRQKLTEDIERIRRELADQDFLAANLQEPDVRYDAETNKVSINLRGSANSKVNVQILNEEGEEIDLSERSQRELLPIKREGQVDRSAIEEGVRRLRLRFQEDGYFFAEVEAVCAVDPFTADDAATFTNNTTAACDFLDGLNLEGRTINIKYNVALNRRFRLTELRLEGTDKLTIEDVRPVLGSQEANILGVIPRLGYGRGYTTREILDDDDRIITSLMRELGYRRAEVRVRQGVTPEGEDLIITFVVNEGPLTRVTGVAINGNTKFSDSELQKELPELVGRPYSRARTRTGNNRILDVYARNGFIDARSNFSIEELTKPAPIPPPGSPTITPTNPPDEQVRVVYDIEREGDKTFINRIAVLGVEDTKRESVLETVTIEPGDLLRADKITESERNLSQTDAFRQVTITSEPAGRTADDNARRDVIIDLREQAPRIISYGGGFSTDDGPTGFVDIRHVNLFGRLYQGGARIRASRRQQQVQLDFTNPRFLRESDDRFAPLTITAQYLRDTGVTRFFRTTLDQGAFGIVQRLDEEGNPIGELGQPAGEPSINRYTFNVETSRTINRRTRSLLFARYRFEYVQLLNIDSLLVAPILQQDRRVRISGFGATFARDTRENCNNRQTLLEFIRTGIERGPCQYNATDPTKGEFLSLDYQLSARFLGGNTSFNKLTATYQRYFQFRQLNNTVLAGRAIVGLANIFSVRDRDGNGVIDESDRTLPISERFFGGGSTTLRGFDFEEAGPRRVIVPQGQFRDRDNNLITLNPFSVPVGGNALAVVNLEARVPLTSYLQVVPFYDGGNVFRRIKEIFNPRSAPAGDIENANLRQLWSNTVGVGIRFRLPIGGSLAVDYGYLLNPPQFQIPQNNAPPAIYRLQQGQIHFRFTQAF
jgi:outer membrane protein insertion porin family